MAPTSPLEEDRTGQSTLKPSTHRRHSSTRSLSFFLKGASSSPPVSPPYEDKIAPATNLLLPPSMLRRASDGSTPGSSTVIPSPTYGKENPSSIQSFTTRVKRSCSTSALTALSLSSTASNRRRQSIGKATIAEPALDFATCEKGDLATRSRSGSASILNELVLPYSSAKGSPSPCQSNMTTPRRPNLKSMIMTSLIPSWGSNNDDAQEILSTSSLSSPSSCDSPTTPISPPLPVASRLPSPLLRAVSYPNSWNVSSIEASQGWTGDKASVLRQPTQNLRTSPSPTKRSRSNTINTCLKSSSALRSITAKDNATGLSSDISSTPRKIPSSLSLRSVPASVPNIKPVTGGGALASPKSPRSPLGQHTLQAYFDDTSSIYSYTPPEVEDVACILKQSSSFGTLLLPSTISNARTDSPTSPATPLTSSHTVYIDHIAVSYNPSTVSGQECKKLLMRLERFKKRSSVDLGTLKSISSDSQAITQINSTIASSGSSDAATQKTRPQPKAGSAKIPRCNSTESTVSTAIVGNGNLSPTNGLTGNNGQALRVIARIRDHRESNKIEAVYADGFKLVIDATGLSHIDMLGMSRQGSYYQARLMLPDPHHRTTWPTRICYG